MKSNSRIGARRLYEYLKRKDKTYQKLFPVYLDASLSIREEDLEVLIKHASQIKENVLAECRRLRKKKT